MEIRKKAITIVAAAGFVALLAGAGLSETAGSDSHQAHRPQATDGQTPAGGGCPAQPAMMGGMMSGMMNGMMGSGMMGSGTMGSGMMGSGTMSGTAAGDKSPASRGPDESATVPAPQSSPCNRAAAHGCANGASAC